MSNQPGVWSSIRIVVLTMVMCLVTIHPLLGADDDLRTWTDISGKYKMPGRFVKVANGIVFLKGEKGEELQIPLTGLSVEDQAVANRLAKEAEGNPFKTQAPASAVAPAPAAPAASASGASGSEDNKSNTGKAGSTHRHITPDFSSTQTLDPANFGLAWQLEIAPVEPPTGARLRNIALPAKQNFHERQSGIVVNSAAKHAGVGYLWNFNNKGGKPYRMVIVDLTTSRGGPPVFFPRVQFPLALRDNGRELVMSVEGARGFLEFWTVEGPRATLTTTLIANRDQKTDREVNWAEFVNDSMLATHSMDGELILWSYPDLEPLVNVRTMPMSTPAVSPDRKYIAFMVGTTVGVLDVAKKEIVASQVVRGITISLPKLAFSPSGNRLGLYVPNRLLVWNTANGELYRDLMLGLPVGAGRLVMCDENYAILNQSDLVDLENQLVAWTYEGVAQIASARHLTLMQVQGAPDDTRGTLVVGQLPHAQAIDAMKKALKTPELFIIKPGVQVAINVNGIGDAAARERVLNALTKKIQDIGCVVGSPSDVEFIASIDGPTQQEMSLRGFGIAAMRGVEIVKVNVYTSNLKINNQGNTLWQQGASSMPPMLAVHGKDPRAALSEYEKPNYSFFDGVIIPSRIQRPTMVNGKPVLSLGKSTLTVTGLQ